MLFLVQRQQPSLKPLCNTSGSGINVGVGIGASSDDIKILKNVPIPQGSTLEFVETKFLRL